MNLTEAFLRKMNLFSEENMKSEGENILYRFKDSTVVLILEYETEDLWFYCGKTSTSIPKQELNAATLEWGAIQVSNDYPLPSLL